MYNDSLTWSGSATLEDVVDYQQDSHYCHHHSDEILSPGLPCDQCAELITPSKKEIYKHGGTQTYYKMPSGICPVCNHTVDEFGNSIDDSY